MLIASVLVNRGLHHLSVLSVIWRTFIGLYSNPRVYVKANVVTHLLMWRSREGAIFVEVTKPNLYQVICYTQSEGIKFWVHIYFECFFEILGTFDYTKISSLILVSRHLDLKILDLIELSHTQRKRSKAKKTPAAL